MSAESRSGDQTQKGSILGRGSKGGPSLPTGPRNGLSMMRKPPSLSTLSLPNFSGVKPPSQSLINALRSLIAQLPQENRDLIRTVTELIKMTAQQSKETKMPLSNLLLVFCPSLNMNPPLLRALCEGEGIWGDTRSADDPPTGTEGVPSKDGKGVRDTSQTDIRQVPADLTDSTPEKPPKEGRSTLRLGTTERRGPVPTIYLDSQSCESLADIVDAATGDDTTSLKDDASYVSTSEDPSKTPSPLSADESHPDVPPPLSSSAESLATPSTSSFSHLPIATDPYSKPETTSSPVIAESTHLPLTPRKLVISSPISGPVQFPAAGAIPQLSNPLDRRRSNPTLSLPTFSTDDSTPNSPSTDRIRRLKKPSLHLLFAKPATTSYPSATSLISFSPYVQTQSAPDSPTSTPTSAVTARSNVSNTNLAPQLDTSIDSSSLGLDMVVDDANRDERRDTLKANASVSRSSSTSSKSPVSTSYARSQTPIADLYLTPSISLQSLFAPTGSPSAHPSRSLRPQRSVASTLSTSSEPLGKPLEVDNSDWTRSVLLAADFGQ